MMISVFAAAYRLSRIVHNEASLLAFRFRTEPIIIRLCGESGRQGRMASALFQKRGTKVYTAT